MKEVEQKKKVMEKISPIKKIVEKEIEEIGDDIKTLLEKIKKEKKKRSC